MRFRRQEDWNTVGHFQWIHLLSGLSRQLIFLDQGGVTPNQISHILGHVELIISSFFLGDSGYVRLHLHKSQNYISDKWSSTSENPNRRNVLGGLWGLCLGDIVVSFFRIFAIPFHHLPVVILQQLLFVLPSFVLFVSIIRVSNSWINGQVQFLWSMWHFIIMLFFLSWTHARTHTYKHVNCSQVGVWQGLVGSKLGCAKRLSAGCVVVYSKNASFQTNKTQFQNFE